METPPNLEYNWESTDCDEPWMYMSASWLAFPSTPPPPTHTHTHPHTHTHTHQFYLRWCNHTFHLCLAGKLLKQYNLPSEQRGLREITKALFLLLPQETKGFFFLFFSPIRLVTACGCVSRCYFWQDAWCLTLVFLTSADQKRGIQFCCFFLPNTMNCKHISVLNPPRLIDRR